MNSFFQCDRYTALAQTDKGLVKGFRKGSFFFRVIGLNSITIYVAMRFVGFGQMSRFFFGGIAGFGDKDWSSFVLALGTVAIEWLVLLFLYRKNTFLKV